MSTDFEDRSCRENNEFDTTSRFDEALPWVSVIIPVYNQQAAINRCLNALQRQTYPTPLIEIIVVDNGSEPPIALPRDADRVRCLREPRPGSYAARNLGIEQSSAPILAFTDADCEPASDWVERGVARVLGLASVGMVGGSIEVTLRDPSRPTLAERYERAWAFPQASYIADQGFSATANLFTTRQTFERVGLFDPSLLSSGDWEWGQRVRARGLPQVYAADVVVRHPARRTVVELATKAARVAAGIQLLAKRHGRSTRGLLGSVKRLFQRVPSHFADARVGTLWTRLNLALLTAFVELVVVVVRSRVFLTGRETLVPRDARVFRNSGQQNDDLRAQSVRGSAAVLAAQSAQFVLAIGSTVALARLLTPDDFGLMAMVAALTSLLGLFLDLGLSSATVQRHELTSGQVSGLFWANVAFGSLLSLAMLASSPFVARFYGRQELVGVIAVTSCGFLITASGGQHSALLQRAMRFSTLARIDVASTALGVLVAITAAALGAGYWSLVAQLLTQQAASATGVWLTSNWRPSRPSRVPGLRPLLSFGLGLTGFNTLVYLSRNLDNLIIGRVAGGEALGFYSKAYSLLMLPITRVRAPLAGVVVPALSRLQHDRPRFKRFYLKALMGIASIGMPLSAFLFVFADDVVRLVLGPKWLASALLFKVLAPAAFVETFNTVGSWVCVPYGRSGRLLRWQMVATSVTVGSFLIGARWGAFGVALAFTIATLVLRVPSMIYLLADSPIAISDVAATLARPALASLAPAAGWFLLRSVLVGCVTSLEMLAIAGPLYGTAYATLWRVLPGGRRSWEELRSLAPALWPMRARSAEM